jgi:Mrp family chromosome partitioning ATPase
MLATLVESSADYVLVDTPPLLAFGDAGALASSVDGVVMVANVEKARRPILEDGREVLDALPCRKVGLVVVGERLDETQYAGYSRYSSGRQEH